MTPTTPLVPRNAAAIAPTDAAWALLPVAALVAGALVHGPWSLAGAAAGAVAAWVVSGWGGGLRGASMAAAVPPLGVFGEAALAPLATLVLVAAAQRLRAPDLLLAGALGVLLPIPGAWAVPALTGSAYLALAPGGRAVLGAAVALVPVGLAAAGLGSAAAVAGAPLAVGLGLLARTLAAHPANLTMARRIADAGLLLLPAPALALFALAAIDRIPLEARAMFPLAVGAALLGTVLWAAHVGASLLVRAREPGCAMWVTLTWMVFAAGIGAFTAAGLQSALSTAAGWVAVTAAVPFGIGAPWALSHVLLRQRRVRNVD